MNLKKIRESMTKEEFLDSQLTTGDGCPGMYGYKEYCSNSTSCKECWRKAIEENNIKFKDDTEQLKSEEGRVVKALELIKNYCEGRICEDCKFDCNGYRCLIIKCIDHINPSLFEISKLKEAINPISIIYLVEHTEGRKQYTFISDETLSIGDMVVCDTKFGHSYGRVVDIKQMADDGNKKCWKVK
nr:hypothetical protein [Clostridium neonatale]